MSLSFELRVLLLAVQLDNDDDDDYKDDGDENNDDLKLYIYTDCVASRVLRLSFFSFDTFSSRRSTYVYRYR